MGRKNKMRIGHTDIFTYCLGHSERMRRNSPLDVIFKILNWEILVKIQKGLKIDFFLLVRTIVNQNYFIVNPVIFELMENLGNSHGSGYRVIDGGHHY